MTRNLSENKVPRITPIIGLLISLLLPALYVIGVVPSFIRSNINEQSKNIIGLSVLWIITVILLIYIRLIEKRKLRSIGFKLIAMKQIGFAIGVGLLCSLLVPIFYYGVSFLFGVQLGTSIEDISQQGPIFVFMGIGTAAVTEEILIRAYPLERINELTGSNWPGILISIVSFLLLHSQSWDILHILGIVLPLGVILTIIYLKTRSLLFTVIVHLVVDLPLLVKTAIDHIQ